ncbi:MAG: IS1182 family transposase [Bacteroidales bacterium]|nr:IS1182 family transposase [Bacteroidales bacterium]
MSKVVFKSYNQNDNLLFPTCLGDFIAENDPVRVLNAVVDNLDLSAIESSYEGGGASSYNPRMLTKVVFYAYLQNVYSGRKMETLLKRDVNFMWLSGMQTPDFNTINLFRKNRLAAVVDDLFTQVVQMLVNQKIISLEVQYVDGTKIEANANKYTFVWKKSTQTNRGKLDRKVKAILAEAEKELGLELGADKQDVMTPAEMTERTDRILDEMDRRGISDRRLRKAVSEVKDAHAEKMREYDEKLEILGERNSYSKTDHDATFMRMKEDAMNNGQTKPGYNVQISTENQFITHYTMSWRPTDWGTFINHMDTFKKRYGKQSSKVVADSGYGNEQNYEYLIANNVEGFVKYTMFHAEQKRKHADNPFLPDNMFYNEEEDYYVCPMGQHLEHSHDSTKVTELGYKFNTSTYRAKDCSRCPVRGFCYKAKPDRRTIEVNHRNNKLKAQARERLMSEEGLYHRSMRPVEPEAVFGQIKYDGGFKRFRYRGVALTSAEFATVAIAHNIKKMISVMDAGRNGRRLSPPMDVPPAARKRVPTSAACGSRA